MKTVWRFLLKLLRRRRMERDLAAELAFHREMARDVGSPVPFGNRGAIMEQAFDLWRFTWIENLWRDVRLAARGMVRNPALLVGALASLGLGIGANTALFSLAVEFLLSQPSVTNPGSVVRARLGGNSHAEYRTVDFLRRSGVFAEVTGAQDEAHLNWNDGQETRRIFGSVTAKNFFTALGVPVAIGRGYGESDPDEVAVLHHHFWRTRFGGDASIVGRTIELEGKAYTIIGVLAENHRTLTGFGLSPDVYVPRYLKTGRLEIFARLKQGQTRLAGLAALEAVGARLDEALPNPDLKYARSCSAEPIAGFERLKRERALQTISAFFAMLLAIAGLVLSIACVNVASLLLSRAAARRREIAIRISIGAGKARLLQQLLVESLLLAGLSTGFGLLLGRAATSALARIPLPLPVPIRLVFELDWRVACYGALLAIVSTLACGLLPALQAVRESTAHDLQREPRQRLRRGLVAAQIAVSLAVLVTGFLFLRNMLNSGAANPGFDLQHTMRAVANLPPAKYENDSREGFVAEGLRVLSSLPGIEAVAAASVVPFNDTSNRGEELVFEDTGEKVRVRYYVNAVTPDYFRVMGIPVVAGRTFTSAGREDPDVVIVNRAFARRFLGSRQALGTAYTATGDRKRVVHRIIGVVEGAKNMTLGEGDEPQTYEPMHALRTRAQFVLRSSVPPANQLAAVRLALRRLEPAAGIEVETMASATALAMLPSRIGAGLMGALGLLGLALAAVGLYGTLAYSVARRGQEIAVRMAIGASRGDVARMVMIDSLKLIAWGSAFGVLAAFLITKPLAIFLVPGVTPGDPLNFAAVVGVFLLVGILAAAGPSRQAASIDPSLAVRQGF